MTPQEAHALLAQVDGTDASALQAHMDWKDVAETLETIADMHWQYAAQVRRGSASPWLYVLSNGHFSKRGSTSVWCKKRVGCENAIRSALNRKDVGADTVEFRIVRRLVSAPEVVE